MILFSEQKENIWKFDFDGWICIMPGSNSSNSAINTSNTNNNSNSNVSAALAGSSSGNNEADKQNRSPRESGEDSEDESEILGKYFKKSMDFTFYWWCSLPFGDIHKKNVLS